MKNKSKLSSEQHEIIISILKNRFTENLNRHPGLSWNDIQKKLESQPEKLWSLHEMERTGGEPDVLGYDQNTGEYVFCDFSAESPSGRRGLCYDRLALESRKEHKPGNSAVEMAAEMGIELLNEEQYRQLQELGPFDRKTSSWILTPKGIRDLGGAIFGDWRYGQVFIYHNGAESYYAARGFRGFLRIGNSPIEIEL
jgi:hypothetical protein